MPIVDVRFDAEYRQVLPSMGDEWAPTWGGDDVLYTGNDDGNSFGGVPFNAMAFGKLEGHDPDHLRGTTVSGMEEYRALPSSGPEGAAWNAVAACRIEGVTYRFDEKNALFRETRFDSPRLISYRKNFEAALGGNPGTYIYAAAYAGEANGEDTYVVGRVATAKFDERSAADWSFMRSDGSWTSDLEIADPMPNSTRLGPDGANWKTMNSYSVDGVLYMFVTRCLYPSGSNDPKRRHVFQHSSIIKSTDGGKIWTRPAHENYLRPVFPGKRFGAPYFVWYGKDGQSSVDNGDKYVYAVSNNGHFENGDDYVLGRVLRDKLPQLSSTDWSFYQGGEGMRDGSWTSSLELAKPILVNSGHASMTGVTYIESLRRYVMVSWHYNQANFEAGIAAKDLSTVLEFFEAGKPWGPWTKVKSFNTERLGWYCPILGQRFQNVIATDAVQAFLYVTGFRTRPEGGLDSALYKLNYIPVTLSTAPLHHRDPKFVGGNTLEVSS